MVIKNYPFQSNYLSLNGINYHYVDEGAGDPVVMLHGNPTWSFYYRNLISALKDNYRTIVPDHIGCGLSSKPDDSIYSYSLEQRVRDLELLLDHLNVKKGITLVIHDWGGMVGMTFATRHPEKIERLIVLNTGAFHLPEGKSLPLVLQILKWPILGPFLVCGLNMFCIAATFVCTYKPLPKKIKKAYLSPYNSWKNRRAILRFVQDIPIKPEDESYHLVSTVQSRLSLMRKIPIIILWGEKDFVFDSHFLKEWMRYFPQASVKRFPFAGHYVLEDATKEIICDVKKFLTSHPLLTP